MLTIACVLSLAGIIVAPSIFFSLQTQEVLNDPTLTTEQVVEEIESITEALSNSTEVEADTVLYPQEIQSTNEIVEDIIDFLIDTVTEGITLTDLNTVKKYPVCKPIFHL